jgi:hypothetical protein
MKAITVATAVLVAAGPTGCSASSSPLNTPGASASASAVATYEGFELLTHCGITHTVVNGTYYAADPVLSDGNGNPPAGWGNPGQRGVLTVHSDGRAEFVAGSLRATFVATPTAPSGGICS